MADTALRLGINLGRRSEFGAVSSAIDDLNEVCVFSQGVQSSVDRNAVVIDLLSDPELAQRYAGRRLWARFPNRFDGYGPYGALFSSPWFDQLVDQEVSRREFDYSIRVVSLTYSNPLGLLAVIKEAFSVLPTTLGVLRDFVPGLRKGLAEAREYESLARLRNAVRAKLTEKVLSGEIPVSLEQLDGFLTPNALDSFSRLAIAGPTVEIDDDIVDESDEAGNENPSPA